MPIRGGGRSLATFAYSMIPELMCHLRPMVRKIKVLIYFKYIWEKKNYRPPGSDPPGFQVPSGGHFKEFSLF